MLPEQEKEYQRGYAATYDAAVKKGEKEGKRIGYQDGYEARDRLKKRTKKLKNTGRLEPPQRKSLENAGTLLFLLISMLMAFAIEYGLYSYLSPISLDLLPDQDYFYYGVGVIFLVWTYLTIVTTWRAVKETVHFLYWLVLYIFDRNSHEYMFIQEAKEQQELENSAEYQQRKAEEQRLEEFYASNKESADIYYLLGREDGSLQGELKGFKNTYKESWDKGSSRRCEEEARRSQNSGGGYYSSNNNEKSEAEMMDERLYQRSKEIAARQFDAWAHGDKDWMLR